MATVKGDVHDIGKNIVGVVLGCNGYDIVDLGVMVPAEKILQTAIAEKCDIIGLSGLITPSLDEMVHVAREMQRQGFSLPLMIGGATTSRVHTALRIEPEYPHGVFWVKDASRAVGVARRLIGADSRRILHEETRADYQDVRERREQGSRRAPPVSIEAARGNRDFIDWNAGVPPAPQQPGLTVLADYPLGALVDYIDWTPFFQTWELAGRYPDILGDPVVGEAATSLFADARAMLQRIVEERWVRGAAVVGLFPAAADGDDVIVYADSARRDELERFLFLRQQKPKAPGHPNLCLADYVAPAGFDSADHFGLFAVTAGLGIEQQLQCFERDNDDYGAILLKSLADRLAEAMAEQVHERVRKELWGYAPEQSLSKEDLIRERYQGIRPAPGYPACPDHSEKEKTFRLLDAPAHAGMQLTEGYAMWPAASVCGYYFAHPKARYFVVGPVLPDQVEDYARRKGCDVEQARRLLAANL
jgi:5-methyltetrahydrofolate--homocysteine methyltransferase